MDGVFKGFYKWLKHCKRTPIIPPWAKLLVFYLENKTGKDTDVLANETGKTLSQSFKWKETGLSYKSIGPDIFKELSSSIPIHVHLYSETEDYQKIKLAVNNLKEYLANRTALLITLSDGTNIKVNNVVSCSDPQCLIYDLFPFQTDDPSCNAYDGKCQSDTTQCKGGSYIPAHCYENSTHKCCLPTPRDQDTGDCKDLDLPILSRDTWGAARPDLISNMSLPVTKFFLHHTETGNCQDTKSCSKLLQSIQRYHIGKGWHDIAYNFLIAGSGQTFEGRGWNRIGTHTKNYNDIALAASFIGNFNNTMPSKPALMSARKLLECAVYRKVIIPSYKLYGHYDVTTKDSECPGYTLYNAIRKWSHYQINADKDKPCLRKGGRCWPNYIPCNGTYYESLCEGNSQRQCCIPPFT
ncbi:uncharacterized protein LOC133186939 [Saccostrea echinata]|uniref:uncharacterized protein LOC133186939 n=1 Tax=Saccostrea echinata TaxID=191078 RepID=UPI002A828145|nr:uncharacterized protein LOC133186939 [Saccostrea echinata]